MYTRDDYRRAEEVIEAFEQTRQPKLQVISWPAVLTIALVVALFTAVVWGMIIVMIAWEVFEPALALGIGVGAFLISFLQGGITALIIQLMPEDSMKEIR